MNAILKITVCLFLLISLLFLLLSSSSHCQYKMYYPYGYTIKVKVARVIDGDTFVLSDSQHVRMLGNRHT